MFTGIIEALGVIAERVPQGENVRLRIAAGTLPLADVRIGDSIAVNGVCLTVTALADREFAVDVSPETLACTTLGTLAADAGVNLEKALRLGDRLSGHLVSGHVDGIGTLTQCHQQGEDLRLEIAVPEALARYVSRKGSVCVDGVSLTVNAVEGTRFSVQIIPHTCGHTLFGRYAVGDRVNIEVDLIARYLERLLENRPAQ